MTCDQEGCKKHAITGTKQGQWCDTHNPEPKVIPTTPLPEIEITGEQIKPSEAPEE